MLDPVMVCPPDGRADEPQSEFWTRLVLPEPFVSARLTLAADTRSQAESVAVGLGIRAAERALEEVGADHAGGLLCRARARSPET